MGATSLSRATDYSAVGRGLIGDFLRVRTTSTPSREALLVLETRIVRNKPRASMQLTTGRLERHRRRIAPRNPLKAGVTGRNAVPRPGPYQCADSAGAPPPLARW